MARHYDRLDRFFREVWGEHVHHGYWSTGRETLGEAVLALSARAAAELDLRPGMKVCDIGCGYGATAVWMARTHEVEVMGVTISPAQAARAGRDDGVRVVLGDWLRGGWAKGEFDAALALESAEHMSDQRAFFMQARLVLRAGGRLVVTGWQAGDGRGGWLRRPICQAARMPPLKTREQYCALAEEQGFQVMRVQDWTKPVSPTWLRMGRVLFLRMLRRPSLVGHVLADWRFGLAALQITAAFHSGALRYRAMTFQRE